jgi:Flp pilus assembly protein TadD
MSPSKRLLAATLAALSVTACDGEPPKPLHPQLAVIPSKVVTPLLSPPVSGTRDAGAPFTVAPKEPVVVDPLVVAHDAPGIDHLGRAKRLTEEGDVRGAFTEARRALFSTPTDVETLQVVARLARRVGEPGLAAEAWGRVASQSTDDATPLLQQARALLAGQDPAGAAIAAREASRRDPGSAEAFHVTGLAQLSMKELAGAIASFEKAVELNPAHGWALNNLGLASLRANRNERAVEVLERAAELLPHVAYVHNNLGVALERVGRADEAKAAYQHAMDLSPKYVKARLNAARVAKAPVAVEEEQGEDLEPEVHPLPSP